MEPAAAVTPADNAHPSPPPLTGIAAVTSLSSSSSPSPSAVTVPVAGFTFAPSSGTPAFARFNQNASCVCVHSSGGCGVYSVHPFGVCVKYVPSVSAGWGLVELRWESSLLAVCGSGLSSHVSPRTVSLLDARTLTVLSELSFAGGVLDVRVSGERLVCAVLDKVHVFDLRSIKQLYTLPATFSARGVCAVVPFERSPTASSAAFIAVPTHASRGDVSVYSYDGQLLAAVRAHSSAIRLIALSNDGRLLATCSLTGTLIRIFSLPRGAKVLTLRRGTLSSQVNCLAFNSRATRLVVGSRDSLTLHVFNLPAQLTGDSGQPATPPASSWPVASSLLRHSVASLGSLASLSGRIDDIVEPSRGTALIQLKSENEPLAASFAAPSAHGNEAADELLHVVSRTGALLTYELRGCTDGAQSDDQLQTRLLSVHVLHSES